MRAVMCNPGLQYQDRKTVRWYAMRDLKRTNDKNPAYKFLGEQKLKVYTPLIEKINIQKGTRVREQVPYLRDLLFVYASREQLDGYVERIPTLQYRFLRGGKYQEPIFIDNTSMESFIKAVENTLCPKYCLPTEIDHASVGSHIRVIGGAFDNVVGTLLKIKGAKKKRILVEIAGFLTTIVEVEPEFIQFVG